MFQSLWVFPILLSLSISFETDIKTIVTPQNSETNPYLIIKPNSVPDQSIWSINALHPLQLHLINFTIFESASSSSLNITIHSNSDNELISDPSLDILVSFIFNFKHFTIEIDMSNQRNNQISPLFNWDDMATIHALKLNASNPLMPPNVNHFTNLFPLHFILTHEANYLTFTYESRHAHTDFIQQHQFAESLPSKQIFMMMITTKTEYQSVALTQLDIEYTVTRDEDMSTADYLLTIRNKNIYNQYTNEYTVRNKLALAVAEYFKDSPYMVVMTSIEYKINKHDTFIAFHIQKVDDVQWNAYEVDTIYESYQDGEFYYLLCFYLNLEWEIGQDATYVYNQYKNGNEMYIKRDFISLFLSDFPFTSDTKQPITRHHDALVSSTESSGALMEYITTRSNAYNDSAEMEYDANGTVKESGPIMSWSVFICIVVVLLLWIVIMGILIKYIDIKTRRLESNAQVKDMGYWQNVTFEQDMEPQADAPC